MYIFLFIFSGYPKQALLLLGTHERKHELSDNITFICKEYVILRRPKIHWEKWQLFSCLSFMFLQKVLGLILRLSETLSTCCTSAQKGVSTRMCDERCIRAFTPHACALSTVYPS